MGGALPTVGAAYRWKFLPKRLPYRKKWSFPVLSNCTEAISVCCMPYIFCPHPRNCYSFSVITFPAYIPIWQVCDRCDMIEQCTHKWLDTILHYRHVTAPCVGQVYNYLELVGPCVLDSHTKIWCTSPWATVAKVNTEVVIDTTYRFYRMLINTTVNSNTALNWIFITQISHFSVEYYVLYVFK